MKKKSVPAFSQDPHSAGPFLQQNLELAIGHEVRSSRKQLGITIAELSKTSGISVGMLSKIENGLTSPSLVSLQILSKSLGKPISAFFRSHEEERSAVFVKSGQGFDAERRGTRAGHQYKLLGHIGANSSGIIVEPYLITLSTAADTFPTFQHAGLEFIYMLDGEIEYSHGDKVHSLKPGDSLYFDADAPHGPKNLVKLPAVYLAVISYNPEE